MNRSRWTRALCALALGTFAFTALGAIDIEVANNSLVRSQLLQPDSVHRYRVFLPEGAKISAAVKGKKDKKAGTDAPVARLRLLDDFEDDVIADGFLDNAKQVDKGTGSKIKAVVEDTAEYILEVFSEDGSVGAYQLKVKWKSPKKAKIKDEFFFEGDETDVFVSVDEDAQLTMKVKKAGRSTAQPFFDRIEGDEFDQELDDSTKVKKLTVLEGGELFIVIGNTAGEGSIAGSVKIKAPKTKRAALEIKPTAGSDKRLTGKVAVPSKDTLIEADDEDIVGDDVLGASVLVPAGAVSQPTSIQIGTGDPLVQEGAGVAAGPTVFFGPEGIEFQSPVTVTIPFDAEMLDGEDTSDVSVFTSDADGNTEEITDFDVDVDDESVSFQADHFSTFRVFLSGVPAGKQDLDGDGVDDLVLPAPQAAGGNGRVYVFSGFPEDGADTSEADHTIAGGSGENFGEAFAVGDVTGDGQADLLVLGDGVQDGTCFVFAGGSGFAPTSSANATFRFDGAVGFGGMQTVAAGDVNADDVADIVVGGEDGPDGTGAVVVWFGGTGLFSETTSGADRTYTGEQVGDLFGASVAVGDLNDDDDGDLIVGADMIDNPGRSGRVYVQLGGASRLDGIATNMDFIIDGSFENAGFGLNLAAADVTGDGVDDLVASEFDDDIGGPGAVFVFAGGATAFAPGSPLIRGATSDADGVYRGIEEELVGSSLDLSDITGDGVADLILGARGAAFGDGGLFLITGGTGVLGANVRLSQPDVAGPGFFEGFPILAPTLRRGQRSAILAFAPGNEDGDIAAGAAYLFLGDPRVTGATSTDDADITIFGQADEALGGELF